MNTENNIRTNPVRKTNNNLDERYRNPYANNTIKQHKEGASYLEVLELQKKISDLEKTVQRLQNTAMSNNVIYASSKQALELEAWRRRQHALLNAKPTTSKPAQTYKGTASQMRTVQARTRSQHAGQNTAVKVKVRPIQKSNQGPVQDIARRNSIISAKELNKNISHQNYSRALEAYSRSSAQALMVKPTEHIQEQVVIVQNNKKPSLWQRIKRAIKAFWEDETPTQDKNSIEQTYAGATTFDNRGYGNNQRYNQFRDSIPKTTVQIKAKEQPKVTKKRADNIFDRYA